MCNYCQWTKQQTIDSLSLVHQLWNTLEQSIFHSSDFQCNRMKTFIFFNNSYYTSHAIWINWLNPLYDCNQIHSFFSKFDFLYIVVSAQRRAFFAFALQTIPTLFIWYVCSDNNWQNNSFIDFVGFNVDGIRYVIINDIIDTIKYQHSYIFRL